MAANLPKTFGWFFLAGLLNGVLVWMHHYVKHQQDAEEAARKGEPPPPEPDFRKVAVKEAFEAAGCAGTDGFRQAVNQDPEVKKGVDTATRGAKDAEDYVKGSRRSA
jgi:hypothetical protein